ncbi:MAG: hypothetical protein KJO82_06245, partial [Gammaproteobacteria bacterium]|nr:hypothetical protein [Gammaproteobacteria bacterium]
MAINRYFYASVLAVLAIAGLVYAYFKIAIPTERVPEASRLLMLGDLNNDGSWNSEDAAILELFVARPWDYDDAQLASIDVNRNAAVDAEDIGILQELYSAASPYELFSDQPDATAPRVREFFRYQPVDEFVQRPAYVLPHAVLADSPAAFVTELRNMTYD